MLKRIIPVLLLSSATFSLAYEIRVEDGEGLAGATSHVYIVLNEATNVASLQFQLNFDPQLATFVGGTNPPGSLCESFLSFFDSQPNFVNVILARETGLNSGSGVLVLLDFQIHAGAEPGMSSELSIAERELGDENGADIAWRASVSHLSGRLWVVMSDQTDSDNDGLSDYLEQKYNGAGDYNPYNAVINPSGTDCDIGNPDTDGDGMTDGQEWIAGTDALNGDAFFCISDMASPHDNRLVIQWSATTGRVYRLQRSTNLTQGTESFQTVADDLPSQPPANAYTDTVSDAWGTLYYRVRAHKNQ